MDARLDSAKSNPTTSYDAEVPTIQLNPQAFQYQTTQIHVSHARSIEHRGTGSSPYLPAAAGFGGPEPRCIYAALCRPWPFFFHSHVGDFFARRELFIATVSMASSFEGQRGPESDNNHAAESRSQEDSRESHTSSESHMSEELQTSESMSSRSDYEAIEATDRAELTRVASEVKVGNPQQSMRSRFLVRYN